MAVECGTCKYCLDKPKFGGKSVLRQSCIKKKCHNMLAFTSQGEDVECFVPIIFIKYRSENG